MTAIEQMIAGQKKKEELTHAAAVETAEKAQVLPTGVATPAPARVAPVVPEAIQVPAPNQPATKVENGIVVQQPGTNLSPGATTPLVTPTTVSLKQDVVTVSPTGETSTVTTVKSSQELQNKAVTDKVNLLKGQIQVLQNRIKYLLETGDLGEVLEAPVQASMSGELKTPKATWDYGVTPENKAWTPHKS